MPALPLPARDERAQLLGYLAQKRYDLTVTAFGLTDEQARATPTASALSIGGLLKHCASVERSWMNTVRQRTGTDSTDYQEGFVLREDETLAGVLADYDRAAAATDEIVSELPLDSDVPVPRDRPWFPRDVEAWTVRWVVLHLIQETARHTGHADILREHLDGATAYALMAAAEGWPETPWLKPWQPSDTTVSPISPS